mmetsp:Transcript_45719/g.87412  ORF Transcript_45719/g.87412 Transcript_45719/m.87412 type:complete len:171 (-) Transcript_45719:374-886(-)|eukprot:CAMPEP_0114252222 /NCGR_PEP_ID=MMETSP0058-20121206/15718_1 /TAXON_ID=36894 /ORGANISM="Pyramimonas parkeae, CCMP726" /LENGTH=170 /DNA_ID=CAMNT_0001366135 /DNA_START=194 /DNA_END=706 /DNA_ORIENTATION=-
MVYHSSIDPAGCSAPCGCALLPLRTQTRGPAPITQGVDIVDEAISFYRANVLYRNYDVKGPSDKTLIYLELCIGQFLKRFEGCKTKPDAYKMVNTLVLEPFLMPGDAGFALGGFVHAPSNRTDAENWRAYFKQAREETGLRLLEKCYTAEGGHNKYWMAFSSRKFLNKTI